eukprot:761935-Hanusia_phi.AAC.1
MPAPPGRSGAARRQRTASGPRRRATRGAAVEALSFSGLRGQCPGTPGGFAWGSAQDPQSGPLIFPEYTPPLVPHSVVPLLSEASARRARPPFPPSWKHQGYADHAPSFSLKLMGASCAFRLVEGWGSTSKDSKSASLGTNCPPRGEKVIFSSISLPDDFLVGQQFTYPMSPPITPDICRSAGWVYTLKSLPGMARLASRITTGLMNPRAPKGGSSSDNIRGGVGILLTKHRVVIITQRKGSTQQGHPSTGHFECISFAPSFHDGGGGLKVSRGG